MCGASPVSGAVPAGVSPFRGADFQPPLGRVDEKISFPRLAEKSAAFATAAAEFLDKQRSSIKADGGADGAADGKGEGRFARVVARLFGQSADERVRECAHP